jgi:HAD superfamily hydrolase (TIGR01490 family)
VSLVIFDLDNTLIADDSDYLWGQFLVDRGIVDPEYYESQNLKFYEDYQQGVLDIVKFLHFSLAPLALHDAEQLHHWRAEFIAEKIQPIVLPAAQELVEKHRSQGDTLVIVTATNRFVTTPIAELFNIEHLLATTPEFKHGQYTGKFLGSPCYQAGKITYLQDWLQTRPESLDDSWFYSDSHNDLPLLQLAQHPVAVDPDPILQKHAAAQGWSIISLR